VVGEAGAVQPVRTEAGCYLRFYEGVVSALRSGGPAPVEPEEAIAVLDVIEAARASAERGQVQRLA
jgi:predicted dehydrogenase